MVMARELKRGGGRARPVARTNFFFFFWGKDIAPGTYALAVIHDEL